MCARTAQKNVYWRGQVLGDGPVGTPYMDEWDERLVPPCMQALASGSKLLLGITVTVTVLHDTVGL